MRRREGGSGRRDGETEGQRGGTRICADFSEAKVGAEVCGLRLIGEGRERLSYSLALAATARRGENKTAGITLVRDTGGSLQISAAAAEDAAEKFFDERELAAMHGGQGRPPLRAQGTS